MLLNFIVIVQEPWKASVSEVNQITPRDGTEPRALDVNSRPSGPREHSPAHQLFRCHITLPPRRHFKVAGGGFSIHQLSVVSSYMI